MKTFVLIVLLSSCLIATGVAQDPDKKPPDRDMIGTTLAKHLCKTKQDEHDEEVRVCPGTAGYSLILKGDEKKPQISLLAPDGTKYPIHYWDLNDPAFTEIQESVLWIVNRPENTLAINFRLKVGQKRDYTEWGGYDVVVRVNPLPVCTVGSVPINLKTGGKSMGIAVQPAQLPCLAPDELKQKD